MALLSHRDNSFSVPTTIAPVTLKSRGAVEYVDKKAGSSMTEIAVL
jgi:hypothetical protein